MVSPISGHGIPTSFSFVAFDNTAGLQLFQANSVKGGGNANQNQPAVACAQTQTGTLAQFISMNGPPPGGQLPPSRALTDTVTTTATVTVVIKP